MREFTHFPPAETARRIDFEKAEVKPVSISGTAILVVSGKKPYANMHVKLMPLVYIRQPEYWGIETVGTLPGGIVLPAEVPYTVSLPLAGITGTKGIEVIGAVRRQRIKLL